jgi:hypothetical protein
MNRARNNPRIHLLLHAVALCVLAWVSWTSTARAQVFAPMCDEVGASAIAPLPVVSHARGEIRPGPCSPFDLLDRVDAAPGEQDAPKLQIQAQPTWGIVQDAPAADVRPAALNVELYPACRSRVGAAHLGSIYRPPR